MNHQKEPKSSWFDVLVLENTALPPPKMRKLDHEASVQQNPILPLSPNTSPITISEDELTKNKGGDTDSKQPIITLSNVSTSPESQSLDPTRDVPRSDLSGEARRPSSGVSSFMSQVSSGDFISSIWTSSLFAHFLFRGFLSLEPIGLPRFMRGLDSLALTICPSGTCIFAGAFTAGICDLVILFISVNASGN